jgi:hypothetical protein
MFFIDKNYDHGFSVNLVPFDEFSRGERSSLKRKY